MLLASRGVCLVWVVFTVCLQFTVKKVAALEGQVANKNMVIPVNRKVARHIFCTSTTCCLLDAPLLLNPHKQTEHNDLIGLHGPLVTVLSYIETVLSPRCHEINDYIPVYQTNAKIELIRATEIKNQKPFFEKFSALKSCRNEYVQQLQASLWCHPHAHQHNTS